jgi:hypothetical protein
LKCFTEHLPATFIYAGIDIERCRVFTGTRGRQPAGRCGWSAPARSLPGRMAQLVAALEATLQLHHHEPGTPPVQAKYLHQRTGGMTGSLTHLIRGCRDPRHLGRPGSAHPRPAGHRPHRPRRRVAHPPRQQHR